MLCHLILSLLADKCPSAVLAGMLIASELLFQSWKSWSFHLLTCPYYGVSVLDSLVEPLQKTINFKPKQDAVKQEHDRNEDMIRSALRAISSLDRINGVDYSHKFKSLIAEMKRSTPLWEKYQTIRNEWVCFCLRCLIKSPNKKAIIMKLLQEKYSEKRKELRT